MRVGLLGELEVLDDQGHAIVLGAAKLRSLLAVLALHAGQAVPAEQLVEAVWGDDAPSAVRNGLQGLVSKLRRAVGSERVVMRSGGYALAVERDAVDVHRFERLLTDARAARDPHDAIALLVEAEGLFRGDALAGFVYEDFASAAITRLTELRLGAVEERLDAELGLGRHQAVIGELEALVASHPLRERPRGLLMVALYRAGRQADALRLFQEGRQLLAEELGLDPSPELRRLEAAILAQDPSLDPPVAPTRSPGRVSTIPESLTPLVGRRHEAQALTALLDEHRLVTLVGPGGVGKTRLALEVARTKAAALAHGGYLVELAPFGDPADVRTAIASALDLPDPGRLVELIGDRALLIVLDNCEHVITAAAEAAEDLLRHCPHLRLVATSREGLRIGGETIWPVPPLRADDAVELFRARAHAAGSPVGTSPDEAAIVEDICGRLDGLPLAIELAAARARTFPVRQLAARLQDRFRLLTGGSRTALPRQQTLRAVVDWSYDLLFTDEQRVFERLSVFPGGCDLATAAAVCSDPDLPGEEIEDIVDALVEKSLVTVVPGADELRVAQLQTLAYYGREKLAERGDAERVRAAMAAHFARLCADSAPAFTGDQQRQWLITMDRERENLRAALEWAVDTGDAETALTIAGGASWPHWLSGTVQEGRRWLDEAFAVPGAVSDATRATALTGRGLLTFQSGSGDGVDDDLGTALNVFKASGDGPALAWTYSFYAEVAAARGDVDEGRRRRQEVLAFYDDQPDDPFVVVARAYSRAKLGQLDGDLAAAEHWYRAATDGLARVDRPIMRAICLGMVAEFDERAGDWPATIDALGEAVETSEALGLRGYVGALQARLAWALLHVGATARAEEVYERALDSGRRLNYPMVIFLSLAGLAAVHRLNGRQARAASAATEALTWHERLGPRRMANRLDAQADMARAAAVCCVVLAAIALDGGDTTQATDRLGQADAFRAQAGGGVPCFQQGDLERTRVALTS